MESARALAQADAMEPQGGSDDDAHIAQLPLRTVYVTLIRHGQSVDNVGNIWAGHKDSPLTSMGLAQAQALGRAFADTPLAAIYASDLKRASQTALELLYHNNTTPPPPLVQTQSLREQYFGQAEGRRADEVSAEKLSGGQSGDAVRSVPFPDGESLDQVNARLATAVRRFILPRLEGLRGLPKSAAADPHVCIVAHGIAIAELLRVFMSYHDGHSEFGAPWEDPKVTYQRVRLENTGWTRLQLSVPSAGASLGSLCWKRNAAITTADKASAARAGEFAPAQSSEIARMVGKETDNANRSTPEIVSQSPSLHTPPARPPRRDIFVRLVGPQNQTQHLSALNGSTTLVPTRSLRQRAATLASSTNAIDTSAPGPRASSERVAMTSFPLSSTASHKLSQYSASFMSRAMALGSTKASMLASAASTNQSGLPKSPRSHRTEMVSRPQSVFVDTTPVEGVTVNHSRIMFPPPTVTPSSNPHSDVWQSITAKALPLFDYSLSSATSNSVHARGPSIVVAPTPNLTVEELNNLISTHIKRALERSPARASAALTTDLRNILITAMKKLLSSSGLAAMISPAGTGNIQDDSRLLAHYAAVWVAFFSSTFRWIEAIFLPLVTDPVLRSLASGSAVSSAAMMAPSGSTSISSVQQGSTSSQAAHIHLGLPASGSANILPPPGPFPSANSPFASQGRHAHSFVGQQSTGSSPGLHSNGTNKPLLRLQRIDVGRLTLCAFRDVVVLPAFERLFVLFSRVIEVEKLARDVVATCSEGVSAPLASSARFKVSSSAPGEIDGSASLTTINQLTQMTHLLRSIQSGDEAQRAIDALVRSLRAGSRSSSRGAGPHAQNSDHRASIGQLKAPESESTGMRSGAGSFGLGLGLGIGSSASPSFYSLRPQVLAASSPASGGAFEAGDRSTNRRGWIPRSAVKHGVHAAAVQASSTSPRPSMFVGNNRHLVGNFASEEAYLQALKAAGRQEADDVALESGMPQSGRTCVDGDPTAQVLHPTTMGTSLSYKVPAPVGVTSSSLTEDGTFSGLVEPAQDEQHINSTSCHGIHEKVLTQCAERSPFEPSGEQARDNSDKNADRVGHYDLNSDDP